MSWSCKLKKRGLGKVREVRRGKEGREERRGKEGREGRKGRRLSGEEEM